MCFGEPEPLQGQIWADARRLSPRWNHYDWRTFSLIIYPLRLVGLVGFGGRFLCWGFFGTPLPSIPIPLLHHLPVSKRIGRDRITAI